MVSETRITDLERKWAVMDQKLDQVITLLKDHIRSQDEKWLRHEDEHRRMHSEHEVIRKEMRADRSHLITEVNSVDRKLIGFASRQTLLNAIIGTVASLAGGAIISLLVSGALGP